MRHDTRGGLGASRVALATPEPQVRTLGRRHAYGVNRNCGAHTRARALMCRSVRFRHGGLEVCHVSLHYISRAQPKITLTPPRAPCVAQCFSDQASGSASVHLRMMRVQEVDVK